MDEASVETNTTTPETFTTASGETTVQREISTTNEVLVNETSSSSSSMTDQATREDNSEVHGNTRPGEIAPGAFEALHRSYDSLASEHRKLGERQRVLRAERNMYRQTLRQLTSGEAKVQDLKAQVARLTLECGTISTERNKLREMVAELKAELTGSSLDSVRMTESQIDRMVVSYAGDMMQSSTVDEGFAGEFRKLHLQHETLLSDYEELKRELQKEVESRRTLEESSKMQTSVYKEATDSLAKVREELVEARKETIQAKEQLVAEIERRRALQKEVDQLKVGVGDLRQRLNAETDTISSLLYQSVVGSCSSLPIVGKQDLVMTGADTHLVVESQQLSESNKALKSQLSELKEAKEKAEKQLDDSGRREKSMAETISQLKQELEDISEREKSLEKEFSHSQQKLKEREAELVALRNEKRSWKITETVLNERLEAEHDIAETTRRKLVASQTESMEQTRKMQDVKIQLDEARNLKSTLAEVEIVRQGLMEELGRLRVELHFRETDLQKAEKEAESLRNELHQVHYSQAMTPGEKTSSGDNMELESILKDVFELQKQKEIMTGLLQQQRVLATALYRQLYGKDPNRFVLEAVMQSAPAVLGLEPKEKERVPAATRFPSRLHTVPNMSSIRSSSSGSLMSPTSYSSTSHQIPSQKQKKVRPYSDPSLDRKVKTMSDPRGQPTLATLSDLPPLGIPTETVNMTAKLGGSGKPRVHYENIQHLQEEAQRAQSSTRPVKSKYTA